MVGGSRRRAVRKWNVAFMVRESFMNFNKYVLYGLWGAAGAALLWFIAASWNMNVLLWFFVFAALALAWWGLKFQISKKAVALASLIVSGFWTLFAFLLFFPFPIPDPPQYVVGEVHRFSELEHGFARAFMGALGPNLAHSAAVYASAEEMAGMTTGGFLPNFASGFPFARATFGGTQLLDQLRAASPKGGDPVKIQQFPWKSYEGDHRPYKLGWNKGDFLLGDVAKQMGTTKASYSPHENTLMIKELGKWLGAKHVAVAAVDPRFFYSHDLLSAGTPLPLEDVKQYKYAIEFMVDQNWSRVHNDPGESWWSITKSGCAYSTSGWIAVRLAAMLRDMGYDARVGLGGQQYDTIESPVAFYSGGGEYGRLSNVVVPEAGGMRFKSAVVITDFPLEVGTPRGYGITRMCDHCDRCARACPVSAVPAGDMTVENGVKMWQVDKDKCARFRGGNLEGNCCNECLRVCPYNKPDTTFHTLGNYIIRHSLIAPYLFGNINGLGLEDWLDYEVSAEAGEFNVNRPARWILEEPGYKMQFPYQVGQYIFMPEDRSSDEEWANGTGVKMGKVGITYKGVVWGKVPDKFLDSNGRSRNFHHDAEPSSELPHNLPLPGKVLKMEEAKALLKSGQAFTGGTNHPDDDVYPPRSKYEHGFLSYEDAVKKWQSEK